MEVINVDTVFCLPRFVCWTTKISKILTILQRAMETARLTWCHPFEHWSTQSAFSSQIDQNAPSQPWVDRESNEVKILPKQHLSCFYIKPKSLRDFCQLWLTLTKFDLKWTLESPKFLSNHLNGLKLVSLQRTSNSLSNNCSWVKIKVNSWDISKTMWSASAHFPRP